MTKEITQMLSKGEKMDPSQLLAMINELHSVEDAAKRTDELSHSKT